jgi:hypothetical protein
MPRRKRPARKRTLTELFIKKVKPEKSRVLIWDLKQHGLVLVVLAARVKLFNLQGRIPYAHGKKTPTPSFYPSLVRMPMASFLPFPCPDFHGEKTPSHFP